MNLLGFKRQRQDTVQYKINQYSNRNVYDDNLKSFYEKMSVSIKTYLDLFEFKDPQAKDVNFPNFSKIFNNTYKILNVIIKFILDNIIIILDHFINLFRPHIEKILAIINIININYQSLIHLIYYDNEYNSDEDDLHKKLRDRLFQHYKKSREDLDKMFQTVFLKKRIEEHELGLIFNAINKIITISLYPVTINKGTGKKNKRIRKSKRKKSKRKIVKRKKLIN